MASPLQLPSRRCISFETSLNWLPPSVLVEDAVFGSLRVHVAGKASGMAMNDAAAALFIGGVIPDVDQEQVEEPVIVIIEEHRAGGMPNILERRLLG